MQVPPLELQFGTGVEVGAAHMPRMQSPEQQLLLSVHDIPDVLHASVGVGVFVGVLVGVFVGVCVGVTH